MHKMTLAEFQQEPVSLDLNEVCFDEEHDIPRRMKNQEKVEPLLNGVYVRNEEEWTQMLSAGVVVKLKPLDTFHYEI